MSSRPDGTIARVGPAVRSAISAEGAVRGAVRARLGIDVRALAAFRIVLGLVVLGDLLLVRLPGLTTFYTDDGTLPRAALAEAFPTFASLSLHALSGSLWLQILLLAVAVIAAGALITGYRTRTATLVTVVLLASLQARNPYVLNGGDTIMLSLLVLGCFLPLGARWAIDARRHGSGSNQPSGDERVCSVATAVVLLHFVTIYAVNGVLKYRSNAWLGGTAVRRIFQLEQYVVLLGPFVTDLSTALTAANWAWVGLLTASPLLIVLTGRLRLALAVGFIGAQLGLGATMRLGAFPFAMVAALLLFLPPNVWNRTEDIASTLVPNRDQNRGADRPPAASSVGTVPPGVRRGVRVVGSGVLVCFLLAIVGWQLVGLGFVDVPASGSGVVDDEIEDVSWAFFAPNPPEGYWWYAWEADLAGETGGTGGTVGTLTDETGAIDRPPDAADRYPSVLWKRYGSELRYAGESHYEPLAAYYCDRVGTTYDAEPETVTVYYVEQPVDANGPVGELEADPRIEYPC